METGLKNKIALLVASSEGIARAAAEKFAAEGARLAMCARSEAKLGKAAEDLGARYNVDVLTERVDVSDLSAMQAFVRHVVERFGHIDVCLANSGGPPAKNFLSIELDEWKKNVDLMFLSVVNQVCDSPYAEEWRWPFHRNNLDIGKRIDSRFDHVQRHTPGCSWIAEEFVARVWQGQHYLQQCRSRIHRDRTAERAGGNPGPRRECQHRGDPQEVVARDSTRAISAARGSRGRNRMARV